MSADERIVELEMRLAFHEDAQRVLDEALRAQQLRIDTLEQKIERLTRDLHAIHDAATSIPAELEPPPPHY